MNEWVQVVPQFVVSDKSLDTVRDQLIQLMANYNKPGLQVGGSMRWHPTAAPPAAACPADARLAAARRAAAGPPSSHPAAALPVAAGPPS
jgi:hypothetical protein